MQREKVKSRGDPILLEMRNESVAGGPRWHHEIKDMVCVLAMGRRIRQADAKTIGPWIFFEEISVFWKFYKLKNAAIWPGLVRLLLARILFIPSDAPAFLAADSDKLVPFRAFGVGQKNGG
jgi:hypothetical protein